MNVRMLACVCFAAILSLAAIGCGGDSGADAGGLDAAHFYPDAAQPGLDAAAPIGLDAGSACHETNCSGKSCGSDGCNPPQNCGPDCPTKQICNTAGQCVDKPNVCSPSCSKDQWCDNSGDISDDCSQDNCCLEICNGTQGCKTSETCVHDPTDGGVPTGHCEAPSCNGVQCAPGQICYDLGLLNTGKASGTTVCTCTPALQNSQGQQITSETCADYGMVCDMNLDTTAVVASTCRMPVEFEECQNLTGCGTPDDCKVADGGTPTCSLDCVALPEDTGTVYLCMRPCANKAGATDSSMCYFPFTSCVGGSVLSNHCFWNLCADPGCGAVDTSTGCKGEDAERAAYFKHCTANKANDGICLETWNPDGTDIGLCFQTGTATDKCNPNAPRGTGTLAEMCKAGSWCRAIEPDPSDSTGNTTLGMCTPLCNAAPSDSANPLLNCSDTTTECVSCLDEGACIGWDTFLGPPPQTADSNTAAKTLQAWCMPKCDMFGTTPCADDGLPTPLTLHTGCVPNGDFAGQGYCNELSPTAGAEGASCGLMITDTDLRSQCGDRLNCYGVDQTGQNGMCSYFCNTTNCTDPNKACGECNLTKCCTPNCASVPCGGDDSCGGKCGCPTAGDVCQITAPATTGTCCTPAGCDGTTCGDDGCGGKCACAAGTACDSGSGTCSACTPNCVAPTDAGAAPAACGGDDGCGHPCVCAAGTKCDAASNTCKACTPDCLNKVCGDDGCGGTCGGPTACGAGQECQITVSTQVCSGIGQGTTLDVCY